MEWIVVHNTLFVADVIAHVAPEGASAVVTRSKAVFEIRALSTAVATSTDVRIALADVATGVIAKRTGEAALTSRARRLGRALGQRARFTSVTARVDALIGWT